MKVTIYTDGSAKSNPYGPGGYGAILQYTASTGRTYEKEISAGYKKTTNNRMELMAAIMAIQELNTPCEVELFTDSQYLVNAFNKGWLVNWVNNNWKTSGGGPVKNTDLWKWLLKLTEEHKISWHWIRGHNGNPENERCDALAVAAAEQSEDKLRHDEEYSIK